MDLFWIAILAAVGTIGVCVPYLFLPRARFDAIVIALIVVVAGIVTFDAIAITTDFRDADGFTDCWSGCSGWQDFVGWTFWPGALLWLVLVLVAAGRWLTSGSRDRA